MNGYRRCFVSFQHPPEELHLKKLWKRPVESVCVINDKPRIVPRKCKTYVMVKNKGKIDVWESESAGCGVVAVMALSLLLQKCKN